MSLVPDSTWGGSAGFPLGRCDPSTRPPVLVYLAPTITLLWAPSRHWVTSVSHFGPSLVFVLVQDLARVPSFSHTGKVTTLDFDLFSSFRPLTLPLVHPSCSSETRNATCSGGPRGKTRRPSTLSGPTRFLAPCRTSPRVSRFT